MSDGSIVTNPSGWAADPLTLNSTSNPITVRYGNLSKVIYVEAISNMVWITEKGECYHKNNECSKMNKNKASHVTIDEAEARGKRPCKDCYPQYR